MQRFLGPLFSSPLIRRVGWHLSRVRGAVDRRFFLQLLGGAFVLVLIAAALITVVEKELTLASLGTSVNWGIQTVLGQGDSSYVTSPVGWVVGWFFSLFGVAIIGTLTGALVALVIDFLLKEGQGLGASGYRDHIVVCGWNQTARDLIDELRGDEYRARIVVLAQADKNPAGEGVYFVNGDSTDTAALERAGIRDAKAALIFPTVANNEADMHSILTIMAIEALAPDVRTVAEVNNPAHVEHFRRARVDEILVTSRLASRLLARSALYPGLTELVTDIVSGGDGSELYRVTLPDDDVGLSIDDVSRHLRADHRATLLAVTRAGRTFTNPSRDFVIEPGDDALVLAESLGTLAPLKMNKRAFEDVREAVAERVPSEERAGA
ncbi:MAG: TrkA family potassium uptake protein [Chloroflexi bacterium]|nr:TrkA family potassium uptake protein [Chloroflexota bacterium]